MRCFYLILVYLELLANELANIHQDSSKTEKECQHTGGLELGIWIRISQKLK